MRGRVRARDVGLRVSRHCWSAPDVRCAPHSANTNHEEEPMRDDHELEAALRRDGEPRAEDAAAKRMLRPADSRGCRRRSAPCAWWPAALTDWNFAPAWPRVAALAARRRARHLDRAVQGRARASRPISTWCGSRPPTTPRPTCSIRSRGYGHDDDHRDQDRSSRWLLIGSLALNLFFIGTIGSLAVRHYVMPSQPAATERPRTAAARIERLAAPLPRGRRRETARGVPRARIRGRRRRATRSTARSSASRRRCARSRSIRRNCAPPWPRCAPCGRPTSR